MCGITGFVAPGARGDEMRAVAQRMTGSLAHRGPDAGGIWADPEAGVALGHRRLSIVDLSEAGSQPMHSRDGRYVLTYNGEVYNFAELRAELEAAGAGFRGHSDTEVMLEGFVRWGVAATLERMIGMFAFALWDRNERTLTLVRDRLGIKPLYWARFGDTILFGSEMTALTLHPAFRADIDRTALTGYMRHNYVPAPMTIYRNVHKLEAGSLLVARAHSEPRISSYWTLEDACREGRANPFSGGDGDAVDALEALLRDAVGRRMIADVPLGAFLSGGLDSSTVVALMQAQSSRPVRTFSIGFDEAGYNEAQHAKAVASHLGTDHTELYVSPAEAQAVVPDLPKIYDEPFADSSQIPTFLVSRLARKQVTVALSGDGGDEVFGGYNRYFTVPAILKRLKLLPRPLRAGIAGLLRAVPPRRWSQALRHVPGFQDIPAAGDKVHRIAQIATEDADGAYWRIVSQWDEPETIVVDGRERLHPVWDAARGIAPDFVDRMQFLDTLTYLPDDILTKVDRASMAVALEARVPLLDHRVVAFSWTLPRSLKIRDGQGKWILRQLLYRHVPRALVERPKMGFGVPVDGWLRGPLRGWAEDLLSEDRLRQDGYLHPGPIRQAWAEHLSGGFNRQYQLWPVLMFQAWLASAKHAKAG
jgi:asparagine synthase (glutamine-hydrolysing)